MTQHSQGLTGRAGCLALDSGVAADADVTIRALRIGDAPMTIVSALTEMSPTHRSGFVSRGSQGSHGEQVE